MSDIQARVKRISRDGIDVICSIDEGKFSLSIIFGGWCIWSCVPTLIGTHISRERYTRHINNARCQI
jgi:hypothetical protein